MKDWPHISIAKWSCFFKILHFNPLKNYLNFFKKIVKIKKKKGLKSKILKKEGHFAIVTWGQSIILNQKKIKNLNLKQKFQKNWGPQMVRLFQFFLLLTAIDKLEFEAYSQLHFSLLSYEGLIYKQSVHQKVAWWVQKVCSIVIGERSEPSCERSELSCERSEQALRRSKNKCVISEGAAGAYCTFGLV